MKPEFSYLRAVPKPAPGAGNGLFSTATIYRGHPVCELSDSFCTVLDRAHLADTCSYCFGNRSIVSRMTEVQDEIKPKPDVKACTGCRVVKYCDKTCQAGSWSTGHKYECAIYKNLYPRILPVNVRAVLRIVFLKSKKQPPQDFGMFEDLESHIHEISKSNREQYERIMLSAKAVHEYSKTNIDISTILGYFARLEIDSFNLTTPFYDRIGLCIQPYASHINHSCVPNAVIGFDTNQVIVRALRKIEEGEQISISYIDNTNPFEVRQKELSERYFFTCKCSKCAQGDKAREDQFSTVPSPADFPALKHAERKALDLLASAKEADSPSSAVKKLKSAMSVLRKTKVWPITRQPYVQLRDELIASLVDAQDYQSAFIHAAIRYLRVDPVVYQDDWHPIKNVHAWLLVKVMVPTMEGVFNRESGYDEVREYNVNLAPVMNSILSQLKENATDELPSVKRVYDTMSSDVSTAIDSLELDSILMQEKTNREWKSLEKLVDDKLKVDEADT